MPGKVKIGLTLFNVEDNENMYFQHYLDENDNAFIADGEGQIIFKFDNSCKMTNAKGTLVGTIRLEELSSEKWAFYTVNFADGKLVTEKVLDLKARYPFAGEPEIIKWLVETNQLQSFIEK